jgi:hypothetical protein
MTVHPNEENFPLFKGHVSSTQSRLQIIRQISEVFLLTDFLKIPNSILPLQTTRLQEWKRL